MRRMYAGLMMAMVGLILSACHTPAILNQPEAGVPSWAVKECGLQPTMCSASACCGQDEICGGSPEAVGCPADSCCPVGNTDAYGARRPVGQKHQP